MSYRLFTKLFYTALTVFIILNAIIWFTWTKTLTNPKRKGGDLLRLGYIQGYVSSKLDTPVMERQHVEIKDFQRQKIDMLTIGDSFSNLKAVSYQDNLASILNISILNISAQRGLDFQPVTMLMEIINSGYLDQLKPKYLLLETIERLAVKRLGYGFDPNRTATIADLNNEFYDRTQPLTPSDFDLNLRFINNGNWKFISNNIQYRFRDKAFKSKVVISQLTKPFFSSKQGDRLLYHLDEIAAVRKTDSQTMARVNENLNVIADTLRTKGITLIFMPIADKLTLYEPYLKNRNYPKSIFFEELRKLPKRYTFIDTKQMFSRELAAGVQDLYYIDDTHWSWKGPEVISNNFPKLK